jgi:hypothetical protein
MRVWTRAPWIRAAASALLLAGVTVAPAFAWPDRLEGRPEQLEAGGDSAYYIWTEGEEFFLATTGPGPMRAFRVLIHTDGEIEDVDQVRLEDGDRYELRDGGQGLLVEFHTWDHVDQVRWRVRGGTHVSFDLRVDGHPIRPENVYLGAEGSHPRSPFFRIAR